MPKAARLVFCRRWWLVLLLFAASRAAAAPELNGFSLADASVPATQVVAGGPPRDGIQSVDAPRFTSAEESKTVRAGTPVIGVEVDGEARAYPVHLLEYHQIVNDDFSGHEVAVTYDPLSGTPIVFDATVEGEALEFGVSGLLYESNFLLYDRESDSLWSQMLGRAIAGPKRGQPLQRLRAYQLPFGAWLERHPDTRVLQRPLPKKIDYRRSPFEQYWVKDEIPHPVSSRDDQFHQKAGVLGVSVGGKSRAYLGPLVLEAGGRIVDEFEGHKVRIAYDVGSSAFVWDIPDDVEVTDAYWFSWKTFHPDTEIWRPEAPGAD